MKLKDIPEDTSVWREKKKTEILLLVPNSFKTLLGDRLRGGLVTSCLELLCFVTKPIILSVVVDGRKYGKIFRRIWLLFRTSSLLRTYILLTIFLHCCK